MRDVREIGKEMFRVRLDPLSLPWSPGDCIAVYGPDGSTTRPYSLSGGVDAGEVELLVRRISGGTVSDHVTRLRAGDRVDVSPPFGWFHPAKPVGAPKIFFATGTGIAPFLSAVRSGAEMPGRVYWGVRDAEDVCCGEEFDDLRVCVSRGEPGPWTRGRLTERLDEVPIGPDTHYYACGLDRMIEDVAAFLSAHGVTEDRIHRECFFTA